MSGQFIQAQSGPVARPTEVSGAIEVLHKNSDELQGLIGDLEVRLNAVLAQREVKEDGQAGSPQPIHVPLAGSIYERCVQLSDMSAQLRSILQRLEL